METFFREPLTYWAAAPASVTHVSGTSSWPPTVAAIGHAACVRAWKPLEGEGQTAEFSPVVALSEADGSRKSAMALHGDCLAVADTSSNGLVSIWDIGTWERKQTLPVGHPTSLLLLSDEYLAAGNSNGGIRVWKRDPGAGGGWLESSHRDLAVEPAGRPCMTACFGHAPDGSSLLIGHSAATCRISVWRPADGQLLQTLGCVVNAGNMRALAAQTNVLFAFMEGWMLTMISWLQGHDPVIQVMDVLARQSHDLEAPDRLAGRGRPLAADFRGGKILAIGFEDGAVAAFGYHGWLRFQPGAVGAVRVLAERMQVATGGADGCVRLWGAEGALLACVDVGFQVTALSSGDVHLVLGGARGEVQLLVLATEEQLAQAAPSSDAEAAAAVKPEQPVQYSLYFDSRAVQGAASAAAAQRCVGDHPQAFESFAYPKRVAVTAEELLAAAGAAPQGAVEVKSSGAAGDGSSSSSSSSKFDGKAALGGATRSPQDVEREAAELAEADKRKKLAQMGEDKGVARNPVVMLGSDTSRVGRKCDSVSCLAREGLGGAAFKRCSACKSVWYCSVHCQRTHYRDKHSKECAGLAQAVKDRQRQEQAELEEQRAAAAALSCPPQQPAEGGAVEEAPAAAAELPKGAAEGVAAEAAADIASIDLNSID